MILNEKQYQKNTNSNYDKGSPQKKIPVKFLFIVLIIGFTTYVVYRNQQSIKDKISDWKKELWEKKDDNTNNKDVVTIYQTKQENKIDSNPTETETVIDIPKNETSANNTSENNAPATIATTKPKTENAIQPNTPIAVNNSPKPIQTENLSKHEIERIIDETTNKYGVKDFTTKEILVKPVYDEIQPLRQKIKTPFAVARKGKLWGVIDMKNEVILPFEYDYINQIAHTTEITYLLLDKKDEKGFNKYKGYAKMPDGKLIIPAEYEYINNIYGDFSVFTAKKEGNSSYGVLNDNNKTIVPFEYAYIDPVKVKGYMKLAKVHYPDPNNKSKHVRLYGLVRLADGKIIVPIEYEQLDVMGTVSFIRVRKNDLYGCINEKNEIIVPFQDVISAGASYSGSNNADTKIYFTLRNGEKVAYNTKGEKVPYD